MNTFQKKTTTIEVSCFSKDGFWLGNGKEHVVRGTSLTPDCTTNIYVPSREGVTGKYDSVNDTWEELEDNSQVEFFDENGRSYKLGILGKDFPDWAIHKTPPNYDPEKETVLFKDGGWKVFDIRIGKPYYNKYGVQQLVTEFNFTLPGECTFETPPDVKEDYAVLLVEGKWRILEDHRGKMAYKKDGSGAFEIEELGELPDDVTLTEPPKREPAFDERLDSIIAQREAAYKAESDPLYMEWQYDKTEEAEQKWRDKVAEIKERYPLPVLKGSN